MSYALREEVSFCVACGRHFFFDRGAGRYFALGPGDAQIFARLLSGEEAGQDRLSLAPGPLTPGLARLMRPGGDGRLEPFRLEDAPRVGTEAHGPVRAGRMLVVRAALSYLEARTELRFRAPAQILRRLARARPAALEHSPDPRLIALWAAFERLRPWIAKDQCFALSLAYVRMAYTMGCPVTLVFGITPRPFGAHCWVQQGPLVLNDQLGRVMNFTPIYAQ
ncbi:lasso peptide biosynthesis B2 protein [Sphingobium yanoikuyae]|uniref:Microcin J25-processing protein McjB C-terminal domain-containing protein n=1 Tax=Sphingobium yanoikuyae TaxID=13690 RepID=A0A291N0Q7_SPHYA|nr:lasso peptide biosynthesis B2 protein [Sphingobium yanoikuyae]ATI80841.1 hypothetical protein A6768_13200 [Sphingobium yanoikuyae]